MLNVVMLSVIMPIVVLPPVWKKEFNILDTWPE